MPANLGGACAAALHHVVLPGDARHPVRTRMDWLRDHGLPRLGQIASAAGRPKLPRCRRTPLRLTDHELPDEQPVAGAGTLEQVRRDLAAVEFTTMAVRVLDLPRKLLR